jgi:hypothetical protein
VNRDDDFFRLPRGRPRRSAKNEASAPASPPEIAPAASPRGEELSIPEFLEATKAEDKAAEKSPPPVEARPAAREISATAPIAARAAPRKPASTRVVTAGELPVNPLRRQKPAETAPVRARKPPTPKQAGPRRPFWLWPLVGVGVLGVIVVGGLLGYWIFTHVAARLILSDQPMTVRLPPTADTRLAAENQIDVLMKGVIRAQVPLVQTLELPINGSYDTIIDIDTRIPLKTVITYEGVIPVDTMADIQAKAPINFQNVKKYKNMHFKAKLPMKLRLPVKLVVPVDTTIPFKYRGPLRVRINHVIKAPVGATLRTALNVNQQFRVPVISVLPLRMQMPQHPIKATITESDLFLNLQTMRLRGKPEAEGS